MIVLMVILNGIRNATSGKKIAKGQENTIYISIEKGKKKLVSLASLFD